MNLELAAQGCSGVKEQLGIHCSGLGHKGLVGHRLDSIILEVFSNISDSEILWVHIAEIMS